MVLQTSTKPVLITIGRRRSPRRYKTLKKKKNHNKEKENRSTYLLHTNEDLTKTVHFSSTKKKTRTSSFLALGSRGRSPSQVSVTGVDRKTTLVAVSFLSRKTKLPTPKNSTVKTVFFPSVFSDLFVLFLHWASK